MLKSKKYMVWAWSLASFVGLSIMIVLVTKSTDGLAGLGSSLALLSGVYHGSNVYQKKALK